MIVSLYAIAEKDPVEIEDMNDVTTKDINLHDIHPDDSTEKTVDQNNEMKRLSIDLKTLKLIGEVFIKVKLFLCSIKINLKAELTRHSYDNLRCSTHCQTAVYLCWSVIQNVCFSFRNACPFFVIL